MKRLVASIDSGEPGVPEWPGIKAWLRARAESASGVRASGLTLFLRKPGGMIGVALLTALILLALFAGVLYPGDPMQSVAQPLLWPGQDAAFPLGTDSLGRDVAAQLVHGARTSLVVGGAAAAVGLIVGVFLGSIGGYFGGWVEAVVSRLTEVFQATPTFLLVVVVVALLRPNAAVIAFAIGLTSWQAVARLVRAEFRQYLQSDFVVASRAAGHSNIWLITREILPNVLPSITVMASFKVASAIFAESGLAFLGLGDPNAVSWGAMINEGRDFIRSAWFLAVAPGVAIILTVLSLNLIGDALGEVLNPRLRGEL
jgi:peptide/nickel transport system permease protein